MGWDLNCTSDTPYMYVYTENRPSSTHDELLITIVCLL